MDLGQGLGHLTYSTLVHPGDGVFIHGYSAGLEGRY